MRMHHITRKTLHQHILKEAQLIDTIDTLMATYSHPQERGSLVTTRNVASTILDNISGETNSKMLSSLRNGKEMS